MEITSFFGAKITEHEPRTLTVPDDGVFVLDQLTLAGPCTTTTSVFVKSTFVGEEADSEDEDRESIESDSDSEDDPTAAPTLAIGHLNWGRTDSIRTSMTFGAGERVRFTIVGDGEVHLSGHLTIESLSVLGEDEDSEEDEGLHYTIEAADSDEEDEEDEEFVDVDSDEGETIYEIDSDDIVSPSEDQVDEYDSEDDQDDRVVLIAADSDSDEENADPRLIRRLLLGEGAGDRPASDDEDDALDEAALYQALARDDSEPEDADAEEFVSRPNNKKRAHSGHFVGEFTSPNGKRSKHQERPSGGYKKHNNSNNNRRGGRY